MPFKSKAQRRKFAELLVAGKIKPETYEEWNRETGRAELPERVKPAKKRARAGTRKSGARKGEAGSRKASSRKPKTSARARKRKPSKSRRSSR